MVASLSEKDVADEGPNQLVEAPEIGADDHHGDDDGHRALNHLGAVGPVDLVELGPRLANEAAARPGIVLDRGDGPTSAGRSRLGNAARLTRSLLSRCATRVAPLPPGLVGHGYLVSRWIVWEPHQRQYFLNSTRSGEFRFDFSV